MTYRLLFGARATMSLLLVLIVCVTLATHVHAQATATESTTVVIPSPTPSATLNTSTTRAPTTTTKPRPRVKLEWKSIVVLVGIILMILAMALNLIGSLAALYLVSTVFTLCGIITTTDLFSGFVNKGMLVIALMFVIVHPISHLPVARRFLLWLMRPSTANSGASKKDGDTDTAQTKEEKGASTSSSSPSLYWPRAKLCLVSWAISPLLENVPHVAVLTPIVTKVCREFNFPPSQFLLPMAFSVCSSNWFLIGSASNLIIQTMMEQAHATPIEFFELAKTNGPVSLLLQIFFVFSPTLLLRSNLDIKAAAKRTEDRNESSSVLGANGSSDRLLADAVSRMRFGSSEFVMALSVPYSSEGVVEETAADAEMLQTTTDDASSSTAIVDVAAKPADPLNTSIARGKHPSVGNPLSRVFSTVPDSLVSAIKVIGIMRPVVGNGDPSATFPESATPPIFREFLAAEGDSDITMEEGDIIILSGQPATVRNIRHLGSFNLVGNALPRCHHHHSDDDATPLNSTTEPFDARQAPASGGIAASPASPWYEKRAQLTLPAGLVAIPKARRPAPFAMAIVAADAHGVGQTIATGSFAAHYNACITSCRTRGGTHLVADDLAMHILEAGDTLILRVRPEFLAMYASKPNSEFYVVDALGFSLETELAAKYVHLPKFLPIGCLDGAGVIHHRGGEHFLKLPDWWPNLTFVAFIAVVATAMAEQDLLLACAVAIVGMVVFMLVTVKQAVNYVDWNVYVTGSMAFGIGSAMSKSGLAAWCGQLLVDAGVDGFWMLVLLGFLTSLIGSIVSNRGAIQVMFPIALAIVHDKHQSLTPYAVMIANAAMGGFFTPYGLSPSLIVAGPGGYEPRDYLTFGVPLLVLYTLLSALFTSAVYDFW